MLRAKRNSAAAALGFFIACFSAHVALAQPAGPDHGPAIEQELAQLRSALDGLRQNPQAENYIPDVAVYAKAAEWILRHDEFYQPDYVKHTHNALKVGLERAAFLALAKGAAQLGPDAR